MMNLTSCTIPERILTGNYVTGSKSEIINSPRDVVWNKIIDQFSENGYGIKTIDKSSGIIITDKTSFKNVYTREVKGKPENPSAYVVIFDIRSSLGNKLAPHVVEGDWNVRITDLENGTCKVNINLTNMKCVFINPPSSGGGASNYPIQSLGNFEKQFLDKLK